MKATMHRFAALDIGSYDQSVNDEMLDDLVKSRFGKVAYAHSEFQNDGDRPITLTDRSIVNRCGEKRDILRVLTENNASRRRSNVHLLRSLRSQLLRSKGRDSKALFDNLTNGYSIKLSNGSCSPCLVPRGKSNSQFLIGWMKGVNSTIDADDLSVDGFFIDQTKGSSI